MRKRWIMLLISLLLFTGAEAESISPTTGLPLRNAPVAPVLLSIGHSGKDQPWGVQQADIVYESLLARNGSTRLTALFHDALVNGESVQAGPVRSIRQSHVALAKEWHGTLLYAGTTAGNRRGAPGLMELQSPFFSMQDGRVRAYGSRLQPQPGRWHKAPNNLSVDVSGVFGLGKIPFASRGFRFGTHTYASCPDAGEIRLDWGNDAYMCTYIYEETQDIYLRYHGKTPAMCWYGSSGTEQMQLGFANVIIQYTDYEWLDDGGWLPDAQLLGHGKAMVFTRGKMVEGSWESDGHTVYLDEKGEEIFLAPGKTIIVHFPQERASIIWQ